MEPNVPPVKSDTDPMIQSERSRKRKNSEADSMQGASSSAKPEPQMMIHPAKSMESRQVPATTAAATSVVIGTSSQIPPAGDTRIDAAMTTQVSASRAMTVELNTLRDIMPKLRREIHTYSMNECQLVKELEAKLPLCYEHRDVRLNMVLDEIQRLRLNKRKALGRLREAQVRIVELESGMELSSYEAGELFWDSKIIKLGDENYSARLNILAAAIKEEKSSKENFRYTPVTYATTSYDAVRLESNYDKVRSSPPQSGITSKSEQGFFAEPPSSATTQKLIKTSEPRNQNKMFEASSRIAFNNNSAVVVDAPAIVEAVHQDNNPPGPSFLNLHEFEHEQAGKGAGAVDLEKIVSEAQKRRALRKNFRKKNILIAILPVATVVGLLLLDWQTRLLSTLLSPILGN